MTRLTRKQWDKVWLQYSKWFHERVKNESLPSWIEMGPMIEKLVNAALRSRRKKK